MSIDVIGVTKKFGDFKALEDVTVHIPEGKLVSVLGPSGSGKTTLLRIIAGLESHDSGEVLLHGEDASRYGVRNRKVGFVFQNYALFRHMTVFENVAFGLRVRPRSVRPSKAEIREKVSGLLQLVQIEWLADHYPSQLSGGQRQRVALARSLATEPDVLLLDEPFGALDAKVRRELRRWLRDLHNEINVTSVFVTHDQEEALEVSDLVVVMNKGKIEQVGRSEYVFDHPANPFVFQFLGSVNLFHARVHNGKARIGDMEIESPVHITAHDLPALAYVRPYDIEIHRRRNGTPGVTALVTHIFSKGPVVHLELDAGTAGRIEAEINREIFRGLNLEEGETVYAVLRNPKIFAQGPN